MKIPSVLKIAVTLLAVFVITSIANNMYDESITVSYSKFEELLKKNEIKSLSIDADNNKCRIKTKDKKTYICYLPEQESSRIAEISKKVEVTYVSSRLPGFISVAIQLIPVLAILYFLNMQFSRNKSPEEIPKIEKSAKIADIIGIDEIKNEVLDIIEFLKNPKAIQEFGCKIPKGILMEGPPGVGKTFLAKAIASEGGLFFISESGSNFITGLLGQGSQRVRELFERGKRMEGPCLIFIDEIDSIGQTRNGFTNVEETLTLNQLLIELDGFSANENVFVMAATNRAQELDPALLRPGRFDRILSLQMPGNKSRKELLEFYLGKVKSNKNVNVESLAMMTSGFSCAGIANLVNEASILAFKDKSIDVNQKHIIDAYERIVLGTKSEIIVKPVEKLKTAYHESGHAIAASLLSNAVVSKVTIVPRQQSLGLTLFYQEDVYSLNKQEINNRIAILLGGRAAEDIVFGNEKINSGASDDLRKATSIARKMILSWGLSKGLGQAVYEEHPRDNYPNYSNETAIALDKEINEMLEENYIRIKSILKANIDVLHAMAQKLMEAETIDNTTIRSIINRV